MENKTNHTQTQVNYYGDFIEVDEDLVNLIKKMWSLGIKTNYSCQGDPHFIDQTHYEAKRYRAYIQMARSEAALFFVQQLLEQKMFKADKLSFTIDFDRNPRTEEERITIRFPHRDINTIFLACWNWEF